MIFSFRQVFSGLLFCLIISHPDVSAANASSPKYDTLAGALPPLIKAQKTPYIVHSNIEVPPQKTVTIEPGAVFLFKNFSGLHVRGRLIARGTVDHPIIFTSEFDQSCNPGSERDPNPFDWDGIYMTNDALGSQFSHCEIRYSVYGLISDTKLIRLDPVLFKDNGKNVIVIENEEIAIPDLPFRHVLSQNDPELLKNAVEFMRDPLQTRRTLLRTGSALTVLGGIGITSIFAHKWYKSYNRHKELSSNTFENLNQDHGNEQWNDSKKKWIHDMIIADSGVLLTAVGIYGIKLSFSF